MPWKLTVRTGPRVEHARFGDFDAALAALEERARELASGAPRRTVDLKMQRYEPGQQVAARLELAGPQRLIPNVRGGIDIRGDGSTEAFVGGLRRELLEPRRGESVYRALGRALRNR